MNPPWLRTAPGRVILQVSARPGAGRCAVVRSDQQGLIVALKSPPQRDKANRELLDFLATTLQVPRSAITLARGARSRRKLLEIATVKPEAVASRLRSLASAG